MSKRILIVMSLFLLIGSAYANFDRTENLDSNAPLATSIDSFDFEDDNTGTEIKYRLTCKCYDNGYPILCAPVKKTCYGGPGNYPYTCYVCPESN